MVVDVTFITVGISIVLFIVAMVNNGIKIGEAKGRIDKNTSDLAMLKERMNEDRIGASNTRKALHDGREENAKAIVKLTTELEMLKQEISMLKNEFEKQFESLAKKIDMIVFASKE